MKRLMCTVMALVCLLTLCSCRQSTEDFVYPVTLYYLTDSSDHEAVFSGNGVFTPEVREAESLHQNAIKILNAYFSGPVSETLVSPFPNDLMALSVTRTDNIVHILLNESMLELDGLDLSIAGAAITMTVMELIPCEFVDIRVQIGAEKEEQIFFLSSQDLYFTDLE